MSRPQFRFPLFATSPVQDIGRQSSPFPSSARLVPAAGQIYHDSGSLGEFTHLLPLASNMQALLQVHTPRKP